MEKIEKLIKEIEILAGKVTNNKLAVNFKLYFLLLLILNIEKVLLNRKENPLKKTLKILESTKNNFLLLDNIKTSGVKINYI